MDCICVSDSRISQSRLSISTFSLRSLCSFSSSSTRSRAALSSFHASFLRRMPPTLDSRERPSSRPLPSRLMQRGRSSSGTSPSRTRRARGVFAVISVRCPVASRWQIRLAIVWDFPVPGGPCTSTPLAARILSTIRSCSSLDGFGKKISPSNTTLASSGPSIVARSLFGRISARSANLPGISPLFSICSLIRFKVSVRPLVDRFRRIRAGAYSTMGFAESRLLFVSNEPL